MKETLKNYLNERIDVHGEHPLFGTLLKVTEDYFVFEHVGEKVYIPYTSIYKIVENERGIKIKIFEFDSNFTYQLQLEDINKNLSNINDELHSIEQELKSMKKDTITKLNSVKGDINRVNSAMHTVNESIRFYR